MTGDRKPTVWVLTDGKAGDEQPLIGIAEAMGSEPQLRHVKPRRLFALMMPWGPIDPRDQPDLPGSPIAPPYPDICLATGRRAVAYLRAVKSASPRTLTVFVKDPRTSRNGADLVVVQSHDRLQGANILEVTTAPNRMTPERLDAIRKTPPADLVSLPSPRIAVLVGGNSRHNTFEPSDIEAFTEGLEALQHSGASLMITASRRTPEPLKERLLALANRPHTDYWTGAGENPMAAYLALADQVVVTADSTNMVGEAASTGKPIQIFQPSGGHAKIDRFIEALSREANVGRFPDSMVDGTYPPVNSTGKIAEHILGHWHKMAS